MKNSRPSLVPISTLFLTHLLLLLSLQSSSDGDLTDQVCKKTPYYDLCLSSLQSNPQSSAADVKGLASIMADVLLANASKTLDYTELLIKQATDQLLEKSLAYCAELYTPVVKYTLPQAIDALSKGHYAFAKYGISDAGTEADACQKKFAGAADPSPLDDRNDVVHKLSDIAAAIVDILLDA